MNHFESENFVSLRSKQNTEIQFKKFEKLFYLDFTRGRGDWPVDFIWEWQRIKQDKMGKAEKGKADSLFMFMDYNAQRFERKLKH